LRQPGESSSARSEEYSPGTYRLGLAGIEPSVGSVGDSYDCETIEAVWMV